MEAQVVQNFPILEIISLIVALLAFVTSAYVGYRQVRISQLQADMQDKVELYLLAEPITLRDAKRETADKVFPGMFIRNIGNNVLYLEKYTFNGREYPLGKEVLPPVSSYNGFHYIYLPTDGTTHVSFTIFFFDWKKRAWKTEGYADLREGVWEITYTPCEQRKD